MTLKSGHGMLTVKENGAKFPNILVCSFSVKGFMFDIQMFGTFSVSFLSTIEHESTHH